MSIIRVTISLDVDSIWYMKQLLATDQAYFPERLHRMIIINSPWYFPALYNMFRPFIDARTRDKIVILGADYKPVLLEYMDESQIPLKYGGSDSNILWGSSIFSDQSGLSLAQMQSKGMEQLESREYCSQLTIEEMTALHRACTHPRYRDDPATARRRELLETYMAEGGVEVPSTEHDVGELLPPPHGENERDDSETGKGDVTSQLDVTSMSLATAMDNKDTLFAMPQLQVCDVLTTSIIGIEVTILLRCFFRNRLLTVHIS
jgi:hypothetical protein